MKAKYKIVMFRDMTGEWRWYLLAPNGRIMADSAEGYTRRGGAVRAAKATVLAMMTAVVVEKR